MTRVGSLSALCLALALSLFGCTSSRVASTQEPAPAPPPSSAAAETPAVEPKPAPPAASTIAWLDIPLTDAVTGKQFRLADYKGKPVLLHPFAAW